MKDTIATAENLEEIMKCLFNDWQLEKKDPVPIKSLEEMPYTLVDTKVLLAEMMVKLRTEKEIALGTRRISYRLFKGICCMIQLATRSETFLVDTIALKDEVKVLNEIFTDLSVLKVVVHSGERFIQNLQRNLGLYMVNLFNMRAVRKAINFNEKPTVKSKRRLKNMGCGGDEFLGDLLKEYCSIDLGSYFNEYRASGHHQDWHLRPIADEKIKFARIQVHYLLHIYDKFRNMLIDQNLLTDTYQQNNEILSLYRTMRTTGLTKLQMEVFRVLFDWRHTTAEKHDEGCSYLLGNVEIYNLAKALPKDVEGIKNVISPAIPCPLLEENLQHICELINKSVSTMSGAPNADEIAQLSPGASNSGAGLKRRNPDHSGQNNARIKSAEDFTLVKPAKFTVHSQWVDKKAQLSELQMNDNEMIGKYLQIFHTRVS